MICYKLVRKLSNGSFRPLFINKTKILPIEEWMDAENFSTKGYTVRKGWHCTQNPYAHHLSLKNRV